jgi:23S rRNA pseudouridine2604 synthase
LEEKRLNKAISETGFCSRREADKLIEQGRVTVNGKKVGLGVKVTAADSISVNGQAVTKEVENVYLAFNKPRGITCTTDLKDKTNIIDFINYTERIFPIGRLDKPSEGLIFLTNDGDIVNKILRSKNNHDKEYVVTVDKRINRAFAERMGSGVPILGTVTKKCYVDIIDDYSFKIILTEGLNRQIRRMCDFLGYEVKRLKRIRIMNINLDVPPGKWRPFTKQELDEVNRLVAHSSKTFD